jgi:hypothetical protein
MCQAYLQREEPPILGLIQRGDQVVLQMLAKVQQATIKPTTDEYDIYAGLRLSAQDGPPYPWRVRA